MKNGLIYRGRGKLHSHFCATLLRQKKPEIQKQIKRIFTSEKNDGIKY